MALFLSLATTRAEAGQQDGRWSADWIPNVGAVASVNGNETNGDRLSVMVRGESCDMAATFFTAYTYYKGADFLELQGQAIKVNFNDTILEARVVATKPFLLGHLAFIDFGAEPLDKVRARLSRGKVLSANIVGQDKYFDIPGNTWNTAGFVEAVAAARELCRKNTVAQTGEDVPCMALLTPQAWATALKAGATEKYLGTLRTCAAGRADVQVEIDSLMVSALNAIGPVARQLQMKREEVAAHVKRTALVAAEAGLPSAQHNYAALHNVDPNGQVADLFPNDYAVFLTWTRKAAARKEPRAMFNLAMRLLPDANSPLTADLPAAYILLRQIPDEVPDQAMLRQVFGPVLDEQLDAVRVQLGAEKVAQIEARRASFDFGSLER